MTFTIENRKWVLIKEREDYQLWTSDNWCCDDGDGVELYIKKDGKGFDLDCISGIALSNIYIDSIDFGILWDKVSQSTQLNPIQTYTHTQQCVIIADWICSKFCQWKWIDT